MKSFIEICQMTQKDLKGYLKQYLVSKGYTEIIDNKGYLYAIGTEPVLLTAHMDTVHKERIKEVSKIPTLLQDKTVVTKVSSPQGIGGDDRCGIYMIMNIVKEHMPSILFCEDEESGCVGSGLFAKTAYCTSLSKSVNYIVELDRRGKNDAVFYSNGNKKFQDWIQEKTGYKKAFGTCSDISVLMPKSNLAGVNFSCGYYDEHTLKEYVYLEEMERTQNMVIELLKEEVAEPYYYVEDKTSYGYPNYWGRDYLSKYYDDDYEYYTSKKSSSNTQTKKSSIRVSDTEVTLVVYIDNEGDMIESIGSTKPEAWMNLFMENPELCFADVVDYEYY